MPCLHQGQSHSPGYNHLTAALSVTVRPLSVAILGSSKSSLEAGRSYDLTCRAYGSRPPAKLSWWLGDTRLDGAQTVTAPTRHPHPAPAPTLRPHPHRIPASTLAPYTHSRHTQSACTSSPTRVTHFRYPATSTGNNHPTPNPGTSLVGFGA